MPFARSLRPIACAVLLACAGNLHAAADSVGNDSRTVYQPSKRFNYSEEELAAEQARRSAIVERTQNVFSLLTAELALHQGDISQAMALYLYTLNQTKDPNVAERAMELAINARAYPVAEIVYREWQNIEPTPGPAQRRLGFVRALAVGDSATFLADIDSVMAEANEDQRRRLLLLTAQTGLAHQGLVYNGSTAVRRIARQYNTLPEAAIADAIYNAQAGRNAYALEALDRLLKQDADTTPATRLAIEILAETHPNLLNDFFRQHSSRTLPLSWRELEIDSLLKTRHYSEAQSKLENLLGESANARLYLLAAALAIGTGADQHTVIGHLEKAYQLGTDSQPSRAALLAAMHLSGLQDYQAAEIWADKIQAPEYQFDRLALKASIAADRKDWSAARRYVGQAQNLPEQSGHFFNANDLNRIKLHTVSQDTTPAQALAELNRALAAAEAGNGGRPDQEALSTVLYQRGLLYADTLGQTDKAVADFRRYVQLNPDNPNGMNALGYTLLSGSQQQIEEGFEWIRQAYAQAPDNVQIIDSLGWAYYKTGQFDTALQHLEAAYAQDQDPEIAAHLGAVLWALGQQERARNIWRAAYAQHPQHRALIRIFKQHGISRP